MSRIATFQDGLGKKYGELIVAVVSSIGSIVAGFYINAVLMGVALAVSPLVVTLMYVVQKQTSEGIRSKLHHYAKSGTIASETFRNIQTVAALTSEPIEIDRYQKSLVAAEASSIKVPTIQRTKPL